MLRRNKKVIVFFLVLAAFLLVLAHYSNDMSNVWDASEFFDVYQPLSDQKSVDELALAMREHGISGITDERVEELRQLSGAMPEGLVFSLAGSLLSDAGSGEYDYETDTFTPSRNGVYSFDMEIWNTEKMYTDFLRGVSALGEGELDFTNIEEDLSGVDWDNGTGTRKVRFDWNGTSYTFEAEHQGDWFDASVANDLAVIVASQGGEKRLYFASDGFQSCYVFFRDKEWASSFQEATGLALYESF